MSLFRSAVIFFLISISFLFANQASAITISPLRYLVTINDGESQTVKVKIKNDEAKERIFNLLVLGAGQDENGRPVFGNNFSAAEKWVKPEFNSVLIKSYGEKEINFIIEVPPGIPSGSHYFGLAAEPIQAGLGGVGLSGRLVVLLTLQVAGIVKEELVISKWQGKKFFWRKNWPFVLELKNAGNIETTVKGSIVVKNLLGKKVFRQAVDLGGDILSDSKRLANGSIEAKEFFWPGFYQAEFKVIYGRTQQVASTRFNIWYFPMWSWAVLILVFWLISWRIKSRFSN